MLDVIYLLATFALFALVALIAKAVERLDAPAPGRVPRDETREGDHA